MENSSVAHTVSGLGITHRTWDQVKDALRSHFTSFVPAQVITLTPEMCVNAWKNPEFSAVIRGAAIVVADGVGVVWGERRLTGDRPDKIPGIDLADWALEEVDRMAGKVFLLGSKRDVVEKTAESVASRFPRLNVAGWNDGYFNENEENDVVTEISARNPHLLLVGMGSPKQEMFIARHLNNLNCGVAMGIGGSFDVWSGIVKRAPGFFRRTGTEWMYRIISQPGDRLKRIPALMEFTAKILNTSVSSTQRPAQ